MTREEFARASRGLTLHVTSEGQHISGPAWRAITKIYNSRQAAQGPERHRRFAEWLWGEKEQAMRRLIHKQTRLHRIGIAAEKVGKARIALEAAKQELQEEMKS